MTGSAPLVFVVDDDLSMREALSSLIRSVGMNVATFASADEFLSCTRPQGPCCLILDVRLPGLSGLDLQHKLQHSDATIPIIFITGHGDIPMTVKAMKAGAVDFLPKPFRDQDLLDAISTALERDTATRHLSRELSDIHGRWSRLTARERQVADGILAGLLNKQVAANLGVSEITVKIHRRNILRKMGVSSLLQLSRALAKLK